VDGRAEEEAVGSRQRAAGCGEIKKRERRRVILLDALKNTGRADLDLISRTTLPPEPIFCACRRPEFLFRLLSASSTPLSSGGRDGARRSRLVVKHVTRRTWQTHWRSFGSAARRTQGGRPTRL
jgi:hypothetical protein